MLVIRITCDTVKILRSRTSLALGVTCKTCAITPVEARLTHVTVLLQTLALTGADPTLAAVLADSSMLRTRVTTMWTCDTLRFVLAVGVSCGTE